MQLFDSIGVRLKEAREALGKTQADFADAVEAGGARGATRQSQSKYEKGERLPDAGYLAVAAQMGIDVLYVITGRREAKRQAPAVLPATPPPHPQSAGHEVAVGTFTPRIGDAVQTKAAGLLVAAGPSDSRPLRVPVEFDAGVRREYQVIPRFRATASAGRTDGRKLETDELVVDVAGVLAMDRAFMRSELGSDKASFVTIKVQGDSMERTLIDGETIVIDTDITDVAASGIYVVQVGKNLLVKRLVLRMDGGLLVKSDNPGYAAGDEDYSAERAQSIRVVGRMVWPKFR